MASHLKAENSMLGLVAGHFSKVVNNEPDGLGSLPRLIEILEANNEYKPLNRLMAEGEIGQLIAGMKRVPDPTEVAQTMVDLTALRNEKKGNISIRLQGIATAIGQCLGNDLDPVSYSNELINALGKDAQEYFHVVNYRRRS